MSLACAWQPASATSQTANRTATGRERYSEPRPFVVKLTSGRGAAFSRFFPVVFSGSVFRDRASRPVAVPWFGGGSKPMVRRRAELLNKIGRLQHALIVVTGDHGIRASVEDAALPYGRRAGDSHIELSHPAAEHVLPRTGTTRPRNSICGWSAGRVDEKPGINRRSTGSLTVAVRFFPNREPREL